MNGASTTSAATSFSPTRSSKISRSSGINPNITAGKARSVSRTMKGLELEGFSDRQANSQGGSAAAVALNRVEDAVIRNCRVLPGTGQFLSFAGENTRDILLIGNDSRRARIPYRLSREAPKDAVRELDNLLSPK